MFKKILIANRGEIAVRVIRTCHDMNIETATVYSDADRTSLHVRLAEEAYPIGPAPSGESYLRVDRIIGAAKKARADAIHPGYGFLSENPAFARACEDEGIVFIGPPSGPMKKLGDKIEARQLAKKIGLPVIPGSLEPVTSLDMAKRVSRGIGYPVMLKAAHGGGGRGMRLVRDEMEMGFAFRGASSEALTAFGSATVYIEKYIMNPRHVEFQFLCDRNGKGVHLYDRECSVQRRHQKLIEESPSVCMDQKSREKIGALVVKTAVAAGYENAGTMEFIVDQDKNIYFMEVNTRLQVEHPVTECVTGVDLVRAQIEVASKGSVPWKQKEIVQKGWAIECRICAEDTLNNFLPSPGKITYIRQPGGTGIREDSGIYQGWEISPFYDSLLSKLVSWGRTREEAIKRMKRALREYCINGVPTTIPFHSWALETREFLAGNYTTAFIDSVFIPSLGIEKEGGERMPAVLAGIFAFWRDQKKSSGLLSVSANHEERRRERRRGYAWAHSGRREAVDRFPGR